jgi:hypothetical protein
MVDGKPRELLGNLVAERFAGSVVECQAQNAVRSSARFCLLQHTVNYRLRLSGSRRGHQSDRLVLRGVYERKLVVIGSCFKGLERRARVKVSLRKPPLELLL